jgi:hypothetical protein
MQHASLVDATRFNVLLDDLNGSRFVHLAIPDAVRINDHEGAAPALIQAVDLRDDHGASQVILFESPLQFLSGMSRALLTAGLMGAYEQMRIELFKTGHGFSCSGAPESIIKKFL